MPPPSAGWRPWPKRRCAPNRNLKIPANGSFRSWLREAFDRASPHHDSERRLEGTFLSGAIFSTGFTRQATLRAITCCKSSRRATTTSATLRRRDPGRRKPDVACFGRNPLFAVVGLGRCTIRPSWASAIRELARERNARGNFRRRRIPSRAGVQRTPPIGT